MDGSIDKTAYTKALLVQVTYDFSNPTTKLFNREIGGLVKASNTTHCDHLTLIVMYGETGIIEHDGKNIRVVNAADWLLPSCVVPLHAENLSDSSKIGQKNEVLDKIHRRNSSKIIKKMKF